MYNADHDIAHDIVLSRRLTNCCQCHDHVQCHDIVADRGALYNAMIMKSRQMPYYRTSSYGTVVPKLGPRAFGKTVLQS